MKKVYLYQKHDWDSDYYISKKRLSLAQCYCPLCEDYDNLVGEYENEDELAQKLESLRQNGGELVRRKDDGLDDLLLRVVNRAPSLAISEERRKS